MFRNTICRSGDWERVGTEIQGSDGSLADRLGQLIADAVCGTGGFLLAAHDFISAYHFLHRRLEHYVGGTGT
jgi:hypothetical protein